MFIKIFGTAVTFGHLFCNDTEIFEIAGTDRTTHAKQEIGFRGRKSEEWSIKRSTTLLSFKRLIDAYSRTAGRPKRDILHLTLYGRYVLKSPTEKLIQSVKSGGFFFPYSSERVFFFFFFFLDRTILPFDIQRCILYSETRESDNFYYSLGKLTSYLIAADRREESYELSRRNLPKFDMLSNYVDFSWYFLFICTIVFITTYLYIFFLTYYF